MRLHTYSACTEMHQLNYGSFKWIPLSQCICSDSRLQPAFLGAAVIAVLPSVSTEGDVSIPIPPSRHVQIILGDLKQLKLLVWANAEVRLQSTSTCVPTSKLRGWRTWTPARGIFSINTAGSWMGHLSALRSGKLHEVPPGASRARESRDLSSNIHLCSVGTQSHSSELLYDLWGIHQQILTFPLAFQPTSGTSWFPAGKSGYFKITKSQLHMQFDIYTWHKVLSGQCGEEQTSRDKRAQKERNTENYFYVFTILPCGCTYFAGGKKDCGNN